MVSVGWLHAELMTGLFSTLRREVVNGTLCLPLSGMNLMVVLANVQEGSKQKMPERLLTLTPSIPPVCDTHLQFSSVLGAGEMLRVMSTCCSSRDPQF